MKVNEFVKKMQETPTANLKETLEIKSYLSIVEKKRIAQEIINICVNDASGVMVVDKFIGRIYLPMIALRNYTNLEIGYSFVEIVGEYDELAEAEILMPLISALGAEYTWLSEVFDDETSKLLAESSIEANIGKVANSIIKTLSEITELIKDKVDKIDTESILPEGTDIDKLIEMINKLK